MDEERSGGAHPRAGPSKSEEVLRLRRGEAYPKVGQSKSDQPPCPKHGEAYPKAGPSKHDSYRCARLLERVPGGLGRGPLSDSSAANPDPAREERKALRPSLENDDQGSATCERSPLTKVYHPSGHVAVLDHCPPPGPLGCAGGGEPPPYSNLCEAWRAEESLRCFLGCHGVDRESWLRN